MFLRKVFNIFIKQNSNKEILGIRNMGIRNIRYHIGYIGKISSIRNIRYISVKGLSLDQKKQN